MFSGGGSHKIPRLRVAGGAPVFVHWSVVILFGFFGLMAFQASQSLGAFEQILVTILSPLFFLISIFGHELGHAYAYNSIYGAWVTGIYLYAMGGFTAASPTESQYARKSMLLVVAIAGPLVNAVLGGIFLGAYYGLTAAGLSSSTPPIVLVLLSFHGWMQIFLFAYNMLPGIPLDGSNALVGAFRYCLSDEKAKITAYSIGIVVVLIAVILVCIFWSWFAGIFLVMTLIYTGYALYELLQRPKSLTNPTY